MSTTSGPYGAILRLTDPLHQRLYQQMGHLKYQIAAQDYETLFEAIWQDRARAVGWDLQIARGDSFIELSFLPQTVAVDGTVSLRGAVVEVCTGRE